MNHLRLSAADLAFVDRSMARRPGCVRNLKVPVRVICDLLGGASPVTVYRAYRREGAYRKFPRK
jgi:hypothetical protein